MLLLSVHFDSGIVTLDTYMSSFSPNLKFFCLLWGFFFFVGLCSFCQNESAVSSCVVFVITFVCSWNK